MPRRENGGPWIFDPPTNASWVRHEGFHKWLFQKEIDVSPWEYMPWTPRLIVRGSGVRISVSGWFKWEKMVDLEGLEPSTCRLWVWWSRRFDGWNLKNFKGFFDAYLYFIWNPSPSRNSTILLNRKWTRIYGFSVAGSQLWQQILPDRTRPEPETVPKSFRKFNFDRSRSLWCLSGYYGVIVWPF